jgi:hypothetical protein
VVIFKYKISTSDLSEKETNGRMRRIHEHPLIRLRLKMLMEKIICNIDCSTRNEVAVEETDKFTEYHDQVSSMILMILII